MKVALFSTNASFFGPVADALAKRGHELARWKEGSSYDNGYRTCTLMSWCDVAFVEFCQTPLREVLAAAKDFNKPVAARIHRIEIYNSLVADKNLDWSKVNVLFASAEHVLDRFMEKRLGLSKPADVFIAPTNIADPDRFKFTERRWEPPFRIALVGNFVPKKRQYTAIQYLYDLKRTFGEAFRLDIVGSRGLWSGYGNPEYFQNCLDLIEDLDLEDVVTIYDKIPHKEVPKFLSREHAILSNSNEEGTHVSIAEAALTGCIPLVNTWRGAQTVYPPEVAWHFCSGMEFVELCGRIKECAENQELNELSKELAEKAVKKYGAKDRYLKMVEVLESLVPQMSAESKDQ